LYNSLLLYEFLLLEKISIWIIRR